MNSNPIAAVLAALGAASGIPIALAQLDFAGVLNVFDIDAGDSPQALRVLVGVGGSLTFGVLALAFLGAGLALTRPSAARGVLIAAALAGLVTAMPVWLPTGAVIGGAALLLGSEARRTNSAFPVA